MQNPVDVVELRKRSLYPLESPLPQQGRKIKILLPTGLLKTKGQHTAIRAMRSIIDYGYDAVLYLGAAKQLNQKFKRNINGRIIF